MVWFFTALSVVLAMLKLIGIEPVAAWSWWAIFAPFIGSLALAVSVAAILLVAFLCFYSKASP
ncbi:hypothetical protein IS481_11975 [Caldimonas thermodepolymerans]|uniref:Uncharacterized protein n=1 Tax=Caldimonas thermodepolymerans TaxID=215580 RepID=A0A2S5T9B8_9BURK|nr:hypothetical protein [Caldimonas thermodepolymerans]PPE71458.1 hypothetical protein C1702_00190 [Caldimonas thermodepolymerans]QPC30487.1 hypothetical protein IS481_11975 [Caldimonas thermodepolymerans]RDI02930.1 small Trp-rich protein [Caldimonas thermodepolymerans]